MKNRIDGAGSAVVPRNGIVLLEAAEFDVARKVGLLNEMSDWCLPPGLSGAGFETE